MKYWLERQTGKKDLVIYTPNEVAQAALLPEQTCYFRFIQGKIKQIYLGAGGTIFILYQRTELGW